MNDNIASRSAESADVQLAKECGPTRAMRLQRDLGITTLVSLANASVAELTNVWSVGEWTARVMKGSAQGHVERMRTNRPVRRVFVKMPTDAVDQVPNKTLASLVDRTVEMHGYDLESDAVWVGYPRGLWDDEGKMYDFMDLWASQYPNVKLQGFDVRVDEFVEDVSNGSSEEFANAFEDRRQSAFNWAHEVAIPLDDKYTGYFIHRAGEEELDVTTGRRRFEDTGDVISDESDIDDEATFVSDPVGHDASANPTSADQKWKSADNQTSEPDHEWDVGATPGREADIEEPLDKYLSLEPNDQDEPRLDYDDLEGADPGGEGEPSSGKKNWSTGS